MIYTVDRLIEDFRSDVFDLADVDDGGNERDTLWSAADVLRYANHAAAQLASDTLALQRRFQFQLRAGQATLRFPFSEILDALSVDFSMEGIGRRRHLIHFDLDTGIVRDDYGLRTFVHPDLDAVGQPTHFTRDYDDGQMRLWPVPMYAGVITAIATALPAELHPGMPMPFSAPQDRHLMLLWMKKLAYAKQDADTLDLQRSKDFEAEYRDLVLTRRYEVDRTRRDTGSLRPR